MLAVSSFAPLVAAPVGVKVTAAIDSAKILMGKTTRLSLSVEQPADKRVSFPILQSAAGARYIPLLGDSIEISSRFKTDTVKLNHDRIRVDYNLTVQSFDSGTYIIPGFDYVCDRIAGKTNQVSLSVIPVKVSDEEVAENKIAPFTNVAEPDEVMKIPFKDQPFVKWIRRWWWLIVLALALVGVGIWLLRRYRRNGSILPVKPVIPPIQEAMDSLNKLYKRDLWQQGKEKEYYTGLTFILRRYLSREYGIPAMEMTSSQIMSALKSDNDLRKGREAVRTLLDMADFVKFAKVRPLPDDNERCYSLTKTFIRDAHEAHVAAVQRQEEEAKAAAGKDVSVKSKKNSGKSTGRSDKKGGMKK